MNSRALRGRIKTHAVALRCACVCFILLLLFLTASHLRSDMGTPASKASRTPIEHPSLAMKPVEEMILPTESSLDFPDLPNIAPGASLGQRYWIVKKIGGRVEGDAFEAWDMAINRSVVAKCYKEEKASGCIKELAALTALTASPLYDAVYGPYLESVQEGGHQCILQPYLGANLERLMREARRPIPVEIVVQVLHQVLKQLQAAHGLQVVHKDLKADNIVIMDRNQRSLNGTFQVQLIDWGQAELAAAPRIMNSWNLQRHHPPERVLRLPSSYPLDVWGLAHVTLHMLTGSWLFPSVLADNVTLRTYFNELEMISGCIPADMLPPGWKHASEAELQVELTVRIRMSLCALQEPEHGRVLRYLTELADNTVKPSTTLAELSDLLDQMLKISPASRITAAAALAHAVFSLQPENR